MLLSKGSFKWNPDIEMRKKTSFSGPRMEIGTGHWDPTAQGMPRHFTPLHTGNRSLAQIKHLKLPHSGAFQPLLQSLPCFILILGQAVSTGFRAEQVGGQVVPGKGNLREAMASSLRDA